MSTPSGAGSDARLRLIDAAERLMAERGVEGVSLREVGQAAGQRNNSAAQYHFGDKNGLLLAVIAARSTPVEAERQRLIAQMDDDERDVRRLLEAYVVPLAQTLREPSSYLRFLSAVVTVHGPNPDLLFDQATSGGGVRWINARLRRIVPDLSPERFARRTTWVAQVSLQVLAGQERAVEEAGAPLPAQVHADVLADLLTMLEALIRTPG